MKTPQKKRDFEVHCGHKIHLNPPKFDDFWK
jgi:hypothetical protein